MDNVAIKRNCADCRCKASVGESRNNLSRNAPYYSSRDRYLVFMTMETPRLRDGTKVPDAALLLADTWSRNQLILPDHVHVIFESNRSYV